MFNLVSSSIDVLMLKPSSYRCLTPAVQKCMRIQFIAVVSCVETRPHLLPVGRASSDGLGLAIDSYRHQSDAFDRYGGRKMSCLIWRIVCFVSYQPPGLGRSDDDGLVL